MVALSRLNNGACLCHKTQWTYLTFTSLIEKLGHKYLCFPVNLKRCAPRYFHSLNPTPLNHSSQWPDIVVLPTVTSPPSSQVHFSFCFPWTLNWDVLLYVQMWNQDTGSTSETWNKDHGCVVGFIIFVSAAWINQQGRFISLCHQDLETAWILLQNCWSSSHICEDVTSSDDPSDAFWLKASGSKVAELPWGSYLLCHSKRFSRHVKIESEFTMTGYWIGVKNCSPQYPRGASFCPFIHTFLGCTAIIAFWVSPHFLQLDGIMWWCHISIVSHVRSATAVRGRL